MPKRKNDNNLEFIAKKLQKLEKQVRKVRHVKRAPTLNSSSSSSNNSSSSSTCSSRSASPNPANIPYDEEVNSPNLQTRIPPTTNDEPPCTVGETAQAFSPNTGLHESNEIQRRQEEGQEEIDFSTEILDILGADPSAVTEYGPDINKEVANRFEHIATCGINKEIKKDFLTKYLVPGNCTKIGAPILNLELKAAVGEQVIKRDKAIEARQRQMSAGIACLGSIISNQLNVKERNHELLRDLMDVGRILCDIQHSESTARRNFALYSVKKELKDQLSTTKIDKFLFGQDLPETLKAAKALSKSSTDLKVDIPRKPKPSTSSTFPSTSNRNLNWRAGTTARRQPVAPIPPPRQQQPAAPHRGTSSRTYTQRPKQTRRR